MYNTQQKPEIDFKTIAYSTAGLTAVGVGAFIAKRYHVCKPEQFMVRTGLGIKDMAISKHGIQWPFQQFTMINMSPITYKFDLHNMSKEKVEFKLPVVFTVGPQDPRVDLEGFKSYARIMNDLGENELRNTIGGMIEGETRGLTAQMTIEEMFSRKDIFRETVVEKIGSDLGDLGMRIFNGNIQEMTDYNEQNKYFEYRKQRAIQTANYQAQVEVAEAKKDGEIGVAAREGEIRKQTAEIERDAKVAENERNKVVAASNAELKVVEAESERSAEMAEVEARMKVAEREAELQREVEIKRLEQNTQAQRADLVAAALAQAEAKERLADADLYQESKRAEGVRQVYQAQADGMTELLKATSGDAELAKFYLGVNSNLYPQLAKEAANAVRGLQPKMHVWNTGSDNTNSTKPILDLVQSFAPMMDGLKDQLSLSSESHSDKKVSSHYSL